MPFGIRILGGFFIFGAFMSGIALASLSRPGSALESIWMINPPARLAFSQMGPFALVLMSAICIACTFAATGLLRRKRWGRVLAIAILSINMIGDVAAAVLRSDSRTLVGVPIAGLLIWYLMHVKVRRWFDDTVMPGESRERTREG